jgi:Ca2+:H+ antiporter
LAQETFLAVMTVALYGTFLSIQTDRHRKYFMADDAEEPAHKAPQSTARPIWAHALLLVAYMAPVVYLAEQLAIPADYLIETMHVPTAIGGIMIAILVATPESIAAVRAARANQLQRSVNIFLVQCWRRSA